MALNSNGPRPMAYNTRSDETKEDCLNFLEFLKLEGLADEDTTKEKLKDVYTRQYKFNVACQLPSFSEMLFNMRRNNFIKVRDGECVQFMHCRSAKRSEENDRRKERTSAQQSNPPQNRQIRQKKFQYRGKCVAVDQNVTLRDQKRKANAAATARCLDPSTSSTQDKEVPNQFWCPLCRVMFNSANDIELHNQEPRHKLNCVKFKFDFKKSHLIEDKGGVKVTAVNVNSFNSENGYVEVYIKVNQAKRFCFRLLNEGKGSIELQGCQLLQHLPSCELDDPQGTSLGYRSKQIAEGENYDILITCKGLVAGLEKIPILFQFSRGSNFQILRYVTIVTDTDLTDDLKAITPFKAPPRSTVNSVPSSVEPGLPLDKTQCQDNLERIIGVKMYTIPANLRVVMLHGLKYFNGINEAQQAVLSNIESDFNGEVNSENYCRLFRNLLFIEEIQMEVDICRYNLDCVTMEMVKQQDDLVQLEVPGLAENRPSLIKGDKIYCTIVGDKGNETREFEGIVHNVREKDVWLGFSEGFRKVFVNGLKLNVRFTVNRQPIKIQHRSIDLADEMCLWSYLFPIWHPSSASSAKNFEVSKFRFQNPLIESNEEQQQAVRNIVAGTSGSAPYIIYGPPGTGKTMTCVEAITQVLIFHPEARVLACAPSNSAADLIAQRLVDKDHLSKHRIFRIHAVSRSSKSISETVLNVSNCDKRKDQYFYPNKNALSKYKVIVTTLLTAGRLVSANFPKNFFTHVFIDECGHAVEPEAVIAIAGILAPYSSGSNGQLVLVGDPKQLGPVLRSPVAIRYGLGVSLLERLMQREPYLRRPGVNNIPGSYNANVITKLLRNYRSHPELLTVPNELFYENELKAFADPLNRSQLCGWEELPNKKVPVIFHGVIGKDEQEQRSPSFFNRAEVNVVTDYVKQLLGARTASVKPEEIGIISPYNRQVYKIREALKKIASKIDELRAMKNQDPMKITVGSTEEFQGQERKVIIISAVRSDPDLLKLDSMFKLGFLQNPKRFNVAMTRAKCLLIIVGNPYLLRLDPNWNRYLKYCLQHNAYKGCAFKGDEVDNDLIQKLSQLELGNDADKALTMFINKMTPGDEKPWRNEM